MKYNISIFLIVFIFAAGGCKSPEPKSFSAKCLEGNCTNGKGTYIWADGSKYVGEWKNSKRHGFGKYYYTSGSIYEGNWSDDKKNGTGVLYIYEKGKFIGKYVGTWKNDQMHGEIKLYDEKGTLIITSMYFNGQNMGEK